MHRVIRVVPLLALALLAPPSSCGDDKKPQEIKGWGTVTDPDGDCQVTEGKGKVSVKVPGKLHDLTTTRGTPMLNAPRITQEVKGDFVVTVKVTADWKPGERLSPQSSFPYNGAGLLIWGKDGELIRLERNIFIHPTNGPVCHGTPIQFAPGKKGMGMLVNKVNVIKSDFFKDRTTWLRIERAGEKFTTSISHDGKEWTETASLTAKYPDAVRVGTHAINSSDKEFVAEFEEFKVEGKK